MPDAVMGTGDRFQEPRFSVAMPGGAVDWPLVVESRSRRRRLDAQVRGLCPACGHVGAPGHYDARDTSRVRRRVCFGRGG